MILIYSEQENASVGLPPAIIGGVHQHYRTYQAVGHNLAVDGSDDLLISEDAEQILQHPNFRLATASEQDAYSKADAKGAVKEKKS